MGTRRIKFDYLGEVFGYGKKIDLEKALKQVKLSSEQSPKPSRFRLGETISANTTGSDFKVSQKFAK